MSRVKNREEYNEVKIDWMDFLNNGKMINLKENQNSIEKDYGDLNLFNEISNER